MSFISSLAKNSFHRQPEKNDYFPGPWQDPEDDANVSRKEGGIPWQDYADYVDCKWEPFRQQILMQWNRLAAYEVDEIGPSRGGLATLIEKKYGITAHLVENYLRNFERTLPLM